MLCGAAASARQKEVLDLTVLEAAAYKLRQHFQRSMFLAGRYEKRSWFFRYLHGSNTKNHPKLGGIPKLYPIFQVKMLLTFVLWCAEQ